MPQEVQRFVAPDARERLADKQPPKVFVFDYVMTGQLVITADSAAEAYRLAIMWSKADLAENAGLEMDDPEEMGAVQ